MKELDKVFGTETYFHETEKYEDRLDSQTVLIKRHKRGEMLKRDLFDR